MHRYALILMAGLLLPAALQAAPIRLLCEWRADNMAVPDPCPEFCWQAPGQAAYRVLVASSEQTLRQGRGDVWDSGKQDTPLAIAEYAGPPLTPGRTYWWAVQTWEAGGPGALSPLQRFALKPRDLPRKRPHLRAFLNFGGNVEAIARTYDLTFRADAKPLNPRLLTLSYCLVATMVIPSTKAQDLERFCIEQGLSQGGIPESMFVHFAEDTPVRLHVGAERAGNPIEERLVPGWDPANDANGDGRVDDAEFAARKNQQAGARELRQARIPMYFWGPPRDDYVMNVADPDYQEFIATAYTTQFLEKTDGLFIDTTPATVPGGRGQPLVEFSLPAQADGAWLRAMQTILAAIKIAHPDALVTANGWSATPFVIDGVEWENWLNIAATESRLTTMWEMTRDLDRRGKIQMCQYNGIYDEKYGEFGAKVPVTRERDQLFALANYYLAAGNYTYFGKGQHPYVQSEREWFAAADHDVGAPTGPYQVLHRETPPAQARPNLLPQGGFEEDADGDGNPDGWEIVEPVALDAAVKHGGRYAAKIESDSATINNFSKFWLDLKPHTTYTLVAWIKTEGIGGNGAQVYPYGFAGMIGGGMMTAMGTTDWRRYSLSFSTGEGTRGRINFRLYNTTGTAWFDDLALFEGSDPSWVVFSREYEQALVLLRPASGAWSDESARDFALPFPGRPLRADGSLGGGTDKISLRSGEAAIVVR